jgi:hypothetical protein
MRPGASAVFPNGCRDITECFPALRLSPPAVTEGSACSTTSVDNSIQGTRVWEPHGTLKNVSIILLVISQSGSELASGSFRRVLLASSPYLPQLSTFT